MASRKQTDFTKIELVFRQRLPHKRNVITAVWKTDTFHCSRQADCLSATRPFPCGHRACRQRSLCAHSRHQLSPTLPLCPQSSPAVTNTPFVPTVVTSCHQHSLCAHSRHQLSPTLPVCPQSSPAVTNTPFVPTVVTSCHQHSLCAHSRHQLSPTLPLCPQSSPAVTNTPFVPTVVTSCHQHSLCAHSRHQLQSSGALDSQLRCSVPAGDVLSADTRTDRWSDPLPSAGLTHCRPLV